MKNYLLALALCLGVFNINAPYVTHITTYCEPRYSSPETDLLAAAFCVIGVAIMCVVAYFMPDYCTRCHGLIPRETKHCVVRRAHCGHLFHSSCYDPSQTCEACAEQRVRRTEQAAYRAEQAVERLQWQQKPTPTVVIIK